MCAGLGIPPVSKRPLTRTAYFLSKPGMRATFVVSLPLALERDAPLALRGGGELKRLNQGGLRIWYYCCIR